MLINFKTSNYLSFKDEVLLTLSATAIKEFADSNVFEPEYPREKLLKTAAIYGYNSAGKSNLLKAMEFMKKFVLNSAKDFQANEQIETDVFKLNTQTLKRPSCFEIEFIHDRKRFKYGFNTTKERVTKEYLYEQRGGKSHMYFERLFDKYMIDKNLKEANGLEVKTRANALFLSVMAQWNVLLAVRILSWFQELVFLNDITFRVYFNHTISLLADENKKRQLLKMFKAADLGFDNVEVSKQITIDDDVLNSLPDEVKKALEARSLDKPQVLTFHRRFNEKGENAGFVQLNLSSEESLGTQKYFAIAGYILEALLQGGIILIDELDARFHSHLATSIVRFFNSAKDNPMNAQLIFSTHNTNLLSEELLRRDQVYFVEKDDFGSSKLFTIMDKGRRNDASFEKEYLRGEYGAIPKERPQLNLFDDDDKLTLF